MLLGGQSDALHQAGMKCNSAQCSIFLNYFLTADKRVEDCTAVMRESAPAQEGVCSVTIGVVSGSCVEAL